jgi:putative FmdB family regulatory protein
LTPIKAARPEWRRYNFPFCVKGLAMPIYAYRCASCGHAKDVLQKLSEPALTVCPACGAATFAKQVTAAGFQLKGSGWYATDFKGGNSTKKADADAKTDGASSDAAKPDSGKTDSKTDSGKTDSGKSGDSGTSAKAGDAGASTSASSAPKAAGCGRSCACH